MAPALRAKDHKPDEAWATAHQTALINAPVGDVAELVAATVAPSGVAGLTRLQDAAAELSHRLSSHPSDPD